MPLFLEECPNCGATWGPGSEEWDFQECDFCGYPNNDEDECEDECEDEIKINQKKS